MVNNLNKLKNSLNILISRPKLNIKIQYSRENLEILLILYNQGFFRSIEIAEEKKKLFIKVFPRYLINKKPLFKKCVTHFLNKKKVYLKPNDYKKFLILKNSFVILKTSKNIITLPEAYYYNISGYILIEIKI